MWKEDSTENEVEKQPKTALLLKQNKKNFWNCDYNGPFQFFMKKNPKSKTKPLKGNEDGKKERLLRMNKF